MKNKTSDPDGWMSSFPPSPDKIIRFEDSSFQHWPQIRWSLSNIQQLVPTKPIWRGGGAATVLPKNDAGLEQLTIKTEAGDSLSWSETLEETFTDGIAVLHKGTLVHESYFGACDSNRAHSIMSCGKSVAGVLAEMLIAEGVLDETALIPHYLPELGKTAWGDATLRQVLDMLIGMEFHEDYLDANSDVWRYVRSGGMVPMGSNTDGPQSLTEYLVTVPKQDEHGQAFAYREPNVNVLTWLVQRVTNLDLSELVSSRVWQRIGAEHDAYYTLDPTGSCTTISCTLRDFVRLGEFLRTADTDGAINQDLVGKILVGGDRDLFSLAGMETLKGWSYKSMWWMRHTARGTCMVARGAYGQMLYIDPAAELVIARFGSAQYAPGSLYDHLILPLIDTITAHTGSVANGRLR